MQPVMCPGDGMRESDIAAVRAAGLLAGVDRSKSIADCPFTFGSHRAARLLWFGGFCLGRSRYRAPMIA